MQVYLPQDSSSDTARLCQYQCWSVELEFSSIISAEVEKNPDNISINLHKPIPQTNKLLLHKQIKNKSLINATKVSKIERKSSKI